MTEVRARSADLAPRALLGAKLLPFGGLGVVAAELRTVALRVERAQRGIERNAERRLGGRELRFGRRWPDVPRGHRRAGRVELALDHPRQVLAEPKERGRDQCSHEEQDGVKRLAATEW